MPIVQNPRLADLHGKYRSCVLEEERAVQDNEDRPLSFVERLEILDTTSIELKRKYAVLGGKEDDIIATRHECERADFRVEGKRLEFPCAYPILAEVRRCGGVSLPRRAHRAVPDEEPSRRIVRYERGLVSREHRIHERRIDCGEAYVLLLDDRAYGRLLDEERCEVRGLSASHLHLLLPGPVAFLRSAERMRAGDGTDTDRRGSNRHFFLIEEEYRSFRDLDGQVRGEEDTKPSEAVATVVEVDHEECNYRAGDDYSDEPELSPEGFHHIGAIVLRFPLSGKQVADTPVRPYNLTVNRAYFRVRGLSGECTLVGDIPVRGAKNAGIKAIAASLLFDSEVRIENAPAIEDMHRMGELLEAAGATVAWEGRTMMIDPREVKNPVLAQEIGKRLRASVVLTGPMLARLGEVTFPFPGGCVLGERPIDLFLDGFAKMGAEVSEENDLFTVRAQKLRGADIFFSVVSVTATETLMMTACLAEGTTRLSNAAMEPEIVALANFLNSAGARITGAGTPEITVVGSAGKRLSATEAFQTPPDRIEAGSFLIMGALLGKHVRVTDCEPAHLSSLITLLRRSGVSIEVGKDYVAVSNDAPASSFRAVNVRTHEYPGFPTDLQAPMVVYLTQVTGESYVLETIFDARFGYVDDVVRMGADITVMNPHRILIRGPKALSGKELQGPDLRAGLAYILAAATASGDSTVTNAYVIDRGYERIEERLSAIGLSIERVQE